MGRPGRKTARDEVMRHDVISLSWQIIRTALKDPKLDNMKRIEIAEKIVGRELAKHSTLEHSFTLSLADKAALIKRVTSRQRDNVALLSDDTDTTQAIEDEGVIDEKI